MAIMLDLRQAVIQKMNGQDHEGLRDMIEGSVDAQEANLPGLGVCFELLWKNIDGSKQDEILSVLDQVIPDAAPKTRKK